MICISFLFSNSNDCNGVEKVQLSGNAQKALKHLKRIPAFSYYHKKVPAEKRCPHCFAGFVEKCKSCKGKGVSLCQTCKNKKVKNKQNVKPCYHCKGKGKLELKSIGGGSGVGVSNGSGTGFSVQSGGRSTILHGKAKYVESCLVCNGKGNLMVCDTCKPEAYTKNQKQSRIKHPYSYRTGAGLINCQECMPSLYLNGRTHPAIYIHPKKKKINLRTHLEKNLKLVPDATRSLNPQSWTDLMSGNLFVFPGYIACGECEGSGEKKDKRK